jgi:hypothetical protein
MTADMRYPVLSTFSDLAVFSPNNVSMASFWYSLVKNPTGTGDYGEVTFGGTDSRRYSGQIYW